SPRDDTPSATIDFRSPPKRACGTPTWMSRRAVDDSASRASTACRATAAASGFKARPSTSTPTMPSMVSANVCQGGSIRISSGRSRATKLTQVSIPPYCTERRFPIGPDRPRPSRSVRGATMHRLTTVACLLVALIGCGRGRAPKPVPAVAGRVEVAVLPFRTGGVLDDHAVFAPGADPAAVPEDAGPLAARLLVRLIGVGIP